MATYFVAGITGNVGGAAANHLLEKGHTVRALVRDLEKAAPWAERGVELVHGHLNNSAALELALTGVDGAFVMVPPNVAPEPGMPEARAVVDALHHALTRITPPRVVALSSVGSEQLSGLGLITATHWLEEALKQLSCPVAVIRPGSFYENDIASLKGAQATGVFYSMYAPVDRTIPMIATADIGELVADLLQENFTGHRVIELGSPVSPSQVAGSMAEVLGRPVEAQAVPREQWTGVLESFGIPKGRTWAMEEMMDSVNSGWIHFGLPGTESRPGKTSAVEVYRKALQK